MKRYIHALDRKLIAQVGRIPVSFQPYFQWLGRFTTPLLWATAFTAVQVLWVTPGNIEEKTLIIVLFLPLATVMKLFFRRQRPPTMYAAAMRVKSYSFPSSHAYSAVVAGGYLAVQAVDSGMVFVASLLGIGALLIGLSRVHVGAHYPSDVIAGWLLGLCVVASAATY